MNNTYIRTCHTHPMLTPPTSEFTQVSQSEPPYPWHLHSLHSHWPFPLHCSSKRVTRKQSEWLFESSCIASKTLADDAFEQTSTILSAALGLMTLWWANTRLWNASASRSHCGSHSLNLSLHRDEAARSSACQLSSATAHNYIHSWSK